MASDALNALYLRRVEVQRRMNELYDATQAALLETERVRERFRAAGLSFVVEQPAPPSSPELTRLHALATTYWEIQKGPRANHGDRSRLDSVRAEIGMLSDHAEAIASRDHALAAEAKAFADPSAAVHARSAGEERTPVPPHSVDGDVEDE